MPATLYYDTETTGVIQRNAPPAYPGNPHICQLSAQLVDDETQRIVAEMNMLVTPKNWSIPAEASAIHGITTETCERYGMPINTVIRILMQLVRRAQRKGGHNQPFDSEMVHTELVRCGYADDVTFFLALPVFCTMELSTPILNLPPTPRMVAAGFNKPKNPNLGEAYEFFTGKKFVGAHDAMEDVRGCREVHRAILARSAKPVQLPLPTPPPVEVFD